MKKTFLFLSVMLLTVVIFAQAPVKMSKQQAATISQEKVFLTGNETIEDALFTSPMLRSTSKTFIGATYYDLQTNATMPNRIIAHADGTISASWNTCASSATTRGSGYNYFTENSWINPATSLDRIEETRTGWATIGTLGTAPNLGEIVVSHNGSTGLIISTRNTKGTGDWTFSTLIGPEATDGSNISTCLLWPSIATVGNTIHLIACTESDAGYLYQGISTCLVYYRGTYDPTSQNITWDITAQVVGGLTSNDVSSFEGDGYRIAAKGNTVAILLCGSFTDIILSKSVDGGTNWNSTVIFDSPILPTATAITDTPYVSDGSGSLAIADDGTIHVAFGLSRVLDEDLSVSGYSYFPGIDGLLYWNSTMNPIAINTADPRNTLEPDALIAAGHKVFTRPDLDGDDTAWYMSSGTFPSYGVGMTSYPQLVVDGQNVYMIFVAGLDYPFIDFNSSAYYRGVFGCQSNDGGTTWQDGISWLSYNNDCYYVDWEYYPGVADATTVPECIIQDGENVFVATAQDVIDGDINMIWQNSYFAGSAIKDESVAVCSEESRIFWLRISASEIGTYRNTDEVYTGMWNTDGIADNTLSAMKLYPNPANNVVNIAISSKENTNANIIVTNMMGQVVYNQQEALSTGANLLNINVSNFANGIYMVTIQSNSGVTTQKLIVK